jgi:hypothetical protein
LPCRAVRGWWRDGDAEENVRFVAAAEEIWTERDWFVGFGVGATHRACVDRVPVTVWGESSIL